MSDLIQQIKGKGVALALFLTLGGLTACSDLLEVNLPASITDQVLLDPASAENQVWSAVAMFECGYSDMTLEALGFEDLWERLTGVAVRADYNAQPSGSRCDSSDNASGWYANFHITRAGARNVYAKMDTVWTDAEVPNKNKLQAVAALYTAAAMDMLGEFFCEMAFDAGPLLTPDATLALGETWVATALGHIASESGGDFALENGIATSAKTTAYGLRARMRWARGDFAGAMQDIALVPQGFTAWATRELGTQRRNKVNSAGYAIAYGAIYPDINDWWVIQPTVVDKNNPVTGTPWPNPIPFTGYVGLAILPDGRAVRADGIPIRTQADPTAIFDIRAPTFVQQTVGGQIPRHTPAKYKSADDDIAWISWREMWLIAAEIEGGQLAIDRVNDLRDHHGLPRVTYLTGASPAADIRFMIIEERRRELFAEGGRYWSTKIQNLDLLWFPRRQGTHPTQGWGLFGGVRMIMPNSEYNENNNLDPADRGTGCTVATGRPVFQ